MVTSRCYTPGFESGRVYRGAFDSASSALSWSRGAVVATISPSDSMVRAWPCQSVMRPPAASTTGTSAAIVEALQVRPVQAEPDQPSRKRGVTQAAPVEDVPAGARADCLHSGRGAGVEGVRVRDAGHDLGEALRARAAHRLPVEERPPTRDADARRLVEEVADDSDDGTPLVTKRDQGPEVRQAGRELTGPVDGVEDPHPVPIGAFGAELLADDSVSGLLPLDDAAQLRLHLPVEGGHRRPVGLDLDLGLERHEPGHLADAVRERFGQPNEFIGDHGHLVLAGARSVRGFGAGVSFDDPAGVANLPSVQMGSGGCRPPLRDEVLPIVPTDAIAAVQAMRQASAQ